MSRSRVQIISNESGDWQILRCDEFEASGHRLCECDYKGTQMFMIPKKTYQPNARDYLLTYTWYGSCSGCDTLQAIQNYSWEEDKLLNEQQVKDFMTLCKDLVCNIVKPYNEGWYRDEDFTEVTEV